jgi:hypothetical protein
MKFNLGVSYEIVVKIERISYVTSILKMFILYKVCIIYVGLELLEKGAMSGLNFYQPVILRNK